MIVKFHQNSLEGNFIAPDTGYHQHLSDLIGSPMDIEDEPSRILFSYQDIQPITDASTTEARSLFMKWIPPAKPTNTEKIYSHFRTNMLERREGELVMS